METLNPLNTLLKQILTGDKPNNLYFIFDCPNMKDDKFALAKKASHSLVQIFTYSEQPPYPTTVTIMNSGASNHIICSKATKLISIGNTLDAMVQLKTGINIDTALRQIQTEAATAQGNYVTFVFTDGSTNAKATIEKMIKDGLNILCFFLPETDNFDATSIVNIFTLSRVIVFRAIVDVENFFASVFLANVEAPQISTKTSSTTEIFLGIKSSVLFDEYEVHGYIAEAEKPILLGTTTTNKITIVNLQPNTKYLLKVRGKKAISNTFSQFSKEEAIYTVAVSEISKKLQDKDECSKELIRLRNKYRGYKIPRSLAKAGIRTFNACLFGEMGNGKSSFLNTLLSALLDDDRDPCQPARAGVSDQSFTRKLSKFPIYGVSPIKIWDTFGWQGDANYAELSALTKGKLREGFEEGSKQDETNRLFKGEADINNTPHAYLTLCDTWAVNNPDKVKKFKEFFKVFKQETGVPTLVAITKFDLYAEHEPLLKNGIDRIWDYSLVVNLIKDFAKDAGVSPKDVFPILNYQGANEERNPVKDLLALHLLDKIITNIETYFKNYKVLNIVDQSNTFITAILLESLDLSLADFEGDYFRKLTSDDFKPVGLYDRGAKIVHGRDYKAINLDEIVYDETFENDGFVNYTLKIENKMNDGSIHAKNTMRTIRISYQRSLSREDQEIRCEKETLRHLRQKLDIPSRMAFSKKSIGGSGAIEENEESLILAIDAMDADNKLYVIAKQTPKPESTRTNVKCKTCEFALSAVFKERLISEIRKEIDSRCFNGHPNYIFLTNDGYEIAPRDEDDMTIDEIISATDAGKDEILLRCQKSD